jgi:RNA polymerase sigma factor (sigma-70 family)
MSLTTETSITLLEDIKLGKPDAWTKLVEKYRPRILAKLQRKGLQLDDADSYTQEILIELFQRFSKFKRKKRGSFRSWLNSLIIYRAIDFFREKVKLPKGLPTDIPFYDKQTSCDNQMNDDYKLSTQIKIQNIVNLIRSEFTERDWSIFFLYAGEELTPQVIAKELNISENVVYLVKSRMTKRIAKLFKDLY